jgi:ATPase subunit of ABC transporter with duplicated ATPase domains
MIFVSHDRACLRGLSTRVLELGADDGDRTPHIYLGSYFRVRRAVGPRGSGNSRIKGMALLEHFTKSKAAYTLVSKAIA